MMVSLDKVVHELVTLGGSMVTNLPTQLNWKSQGSEARAAALKKYNIPTKHWFSFCVFATHLKTWCSQIGSFFLIFGGKCSSNLWNHHLHLEDGLVWSSKPTRVVTVVTFSSELPNSVGSSKTGSVRKKTSLKFKMAFFHQSHLFQISMMFFDIMLATNQ